MIFGAQMGFVWGAIVPIPLYVWRGHVWGTSFSTMCPNWVTTLCMPCCVCVASELKIYVVPQMGTM